MKDYNCEKISPVNFTRKAVFAGINHSRDKGYNLPGVLILLHHTFINRPATKKYLLKKYTSQQLSNKLSYNVVRAAAILAGEKHPLPDTISLMAHLSCANHICRRWCVHVYSNNNCTDAELGGTCYKQSEVKGRTVISIEYNLRDLAKLYRTTWSRETLLRKLKQEYYGELLPNAQVGEGTPIPFHPYDEIILTLKHQGYYPSIKVQHDLLPPVKRSATSQNNEGESSAEILEEMRNDVDDDSSEDSDYASEEDPSDTESIFDDILCDEVLDDDEDVQT